jgi:hypothetical protein
MMFTRPSRQAREEASKTVENKLLRGRTNIRLIGRIDDAHARVAARTDHSGLGGKVACPTSCHIRRAGA